MTAPVSAPPGAIARLRSGFAGPLVLAVAAGLVGYLLVGQLQGPRRESPPLEAESEGVVLQRLSEAS